MPFVHNWLIEDGLKVVGDVLTLIFDWVGVVFDFRGESPSFRVYTDWIVNRRLCILDSATELCIIVSSLSNFVCTD